MINWIDLTAILTLHIATAVTLCLGFIAAFYIISETMNNLYTDKWWVKINILPDLKIMYLLMLLAPNVIFFLVVV